MSNEREASREAFEKWAEKAIGRVSRSTEPGYEDTYDDSWTNIAWKTWQARVQQEPPTWIPREERMPPVHTDFIALNRDGRIFRSRMCYGMHEPWFTYPRGDKDASDTLPAWIDVTHWMPLPPEVTR